MDIMEKTAEAVAENSEEVVDKAAEIISEADVDWVSAFAPYAKAFGIGFIVSATLTEVVIPAAKWAMTKFENRPPKVKVIKVMPTKDEPPVEEASATEEAEKKSDKETPEK